MQFDQRSALGRGSSHPIWRYATAALMAFISGALFAGSAAADAYVQRSEVQSYIDELVTNHGFSRIALEEVFSESTKQERIIELMSRPAERRLAWHEYRKILVDEPRVSQGVVFWRENKQALESLYRVLVQNWCGIYSFIYTFIVLVDFHDPPQVCGHSSA